MTKNQSRAHRAVLAGIIFISLSQILGVTDFPFTVDLIVFAVAFFTLVNGLRITLISNEQRNHSARDRDRG